MSLSSQSLRNIAATALSMLSVMACAGSLAQPVPTARKVPQPQKPVKSAVATQLRAREMLRVEGVELWRGKYEFENVGVNAPGLFHRVITAGVSAGERPLTTAVKAGARLLRCTVAPASYEETLAWNTSPTTALAALDSLLASADAKGIAIVPVLLGNGLPFVPAGHTIPELFKPDTPTQQAALTWIRIVATHCKNDPRVLFFDLGDGLNIGADLPESSERPSASCFRIDQLRGFYSRAAQAIKAIDARRLIGGGSADLRPDAYHLRQICLAHTSADKPWTYSMPDDQDQFTEYTEMLANLCPAPMDILSIQQSAPADPENRVHWLTEDDEHALRLPWLHNAAGLIPAEVRGKGNGRPLFVCSFGQAAPTAVAGAKPQDLLWITDFVRRLRTASAPISAIANWEEDGSGGSLAVISPEKYAELISLMFTVNSALYTTAKDSPLVK